MVTSAHFMGKPDRRPLTVRCNSFTLAMLSQKSTLLCLDPSNEPSALDSSMESTRGQQTVEWRLR